MGDRIWGKLYETILFRKMHFRFLKFHINVFGIIKPPTGYGPMINVNKLISLFNIIRSVLSQQQSTSAYYRLLANTGMVIFVRIFLTYLLCYLGGWLWVRTKFTMVCATRFPQQALILGVTSAIR